MARGSYELFLVKPSPRWSLPLFSHIFTFSVTSLALSFKIQNFLCLCVSCSLGCDLSQKTRKSDITRGSYERFLEKPGPGRSLPQFWHILSFSAVSLALSFKIQIFLRRCVACSFTVQFKPQNSEIRYHTRELWAFYAEGRSHPGLGRSLPPFWHIFTFSTVSLALSFKIQTFFWCCIACSLLFDSNQNTQKSDIARGSYEPFLVKPGPGCSLPQF
jgi:hypothetical protein